MPTGGKVVATYCVFRSRRTCLAADAIPVGLCAAPNFLFPLRKRSPARNTCLINHPSVLNWGASVLTSGQPSYVGETTCDGKKKMFENAWGITAGLRHGSPQQKDRAQSPTLARRSHGFQRCHRKINRQRDYSKKNSERPSI